MASISANRFGNFSIREYVEAIRETEPERLSLIPDHNVPNGNKDPEAIELEGLEQHETGPEDEDAPASELEGLKQHETGPEDEDAPAFELEGLKQHETGPEDEDAPEIITIAVSDDDDTSRTISYLPVDFLKSQCSNDRTVNGGASNENSIAAATDDGSSRRKLKKIRKLKKLRRKSKKIKRKLKKVKKPRARLIVDIYKELNERKVKSDVLCTPKGNSDERAGTRAPPTIDLRNDADDVTLKSSRKRKAAHCDPNKKQKALKAKEPKLDESETSSHGPKGLNSHGHFATRKLQEAKCRGSGACDGLGGSEPSGSGSVVG